MLMQSGGTWTKEQLSVCDEDEIFTKSGVLILHLYNLGQHRPLSGQDKLVTERKIALYLVRVTKSCLCIE